MNASSRFFCFAIRLVVYRLIPDRSQYSPASAARKKGGIAEEVEGLCEEFEVVEHNQFLFSVFPTLTSSAGLIPQMISDMIFAVSPEVTRRHYHSDATCLHGLHSFFSCRERSIKMKWPIWKNSDVLRALALWSDSFRPC